MEQLIGIVVIVCSIIAVILALEIGKQRSERKKEYDQLSPSDKLLWRQNEHLQALRFGFGALVLFALLTYMFNR